MQEAQSDSTAMRPSLLQQTGELDVLEDVVEIPSLSMITQPRSTLSGTFKSGSEVKRMDSMLSESLSSEDSLQLLVSSPLEDPMKNLLSKRVNIQLEISFSVEMEEDLELDIFHSIQT